MGRWEPDTAGRLTRAAMDLYQERGFDQTTVAEIASRAGLTERTFFRHFADKREVLFGGSKFLQERMVTALHEAPSTLAPIDAVGAAVRIGSELLDDRREFARQRQAIIVNNAELQERELIKLAKLAAALAQTLCARGVSEQAANLAGESGIAVFRVAFERWVVDPGERTLGEFVDETLDELKAVAAGAKGQ